MIKFRAWDKEREEMLPVTNMNWNEWWVSCEPILDEITHPLDYGERNSFKNEETDRQILMQYTGLKDKNGKEIYEGDILQSTLTHKQIGKVIYENAMLKVLWFKDNPFSEEYDSFLYKVVHVCEVSGNIYENPELLEGR